MKQHWSILKTHLRNIILFFIGINIVSLLSFCIIFDNYTEYLITQMEHNIRDYHEINKEHLCMIVMCTDIYDVVPNSELTGNIILTSDHLDDNKFIKITDILYYSHSKLLLYEPQSSSLYELGIDELLSDYIKSFQIFMPILVILFIIPLFVSIRKEKANALVLLAGNRALLANKTMINITENIHHELNTPIEVIDNKIEKIHRAIKRCIIRENEKVCDNSMFEIDRENRVGHKKRNINKELALLTDDFEFIKSSSEQIHSVLEKMKGFKHIKYSNGNKSVKNIIDGGFRAIGISESSIDYKVDAKLAKYSLKILKNAELLSIMINHIKNSIEANADKIFILFKDCNKGVLKFRIIDNGNGMNKEVQNNMFNPNFSTKEIGDEIRGNGMFLNKHILDTTEGSIKVISSSNRGTTLEIAVKVTIR